MLPLLAAPAVAGFDPHQFLRTVAVVLVVAAVTTVLSQRLRLPIVFGYLVAGMIVGPKVPIPLVADVTVVQSLSELGVILLMFSIGLEFRLRKVAQVATSSGIAALVETGAMFGLGVLAADLMGWNAFERLVAGAMVAISSTTIISRVFAERGVRGPTRDLVFGILIIEDLIAILLLATLGALATGGGLGWGEVGLTLLRLASFLAGFIVVGLLAVPPLMRGVLALKRDETILVTAIGISFAAALVALAFQYSVALGAFLAGTLIAETGAGEQVDHLIMPVRDVFVAIFFVSVGMLLDPTEVREHLGAIVLFTGLVMAGKTIAASTGAFLSGGGLRPSVEAGVSLAQIGEFSFLIAALGTKAGARPELFSIAVAVSTVTTLTTPFLVARSGTVAAWVDRKLPTRLQTFTALYGSWIARVREAPRAELPRERKLARRLALDTLLLAAVIIGAAAERARFAQVLAKVLDVPVVTGSRIVWLGALLLAIPVVGAAYLSARELARHIATRALPGGGRMDRAWAPRRALTATVHAGLMVLTITIPLLLLQPLLPRYTAPVAVLGLATVLMAAVWQATRELEGHARAGAEVIATALVQELNRQTAEHNLNRTMEMMAVMLPGLGEPELVTVAEGSRVCGRTLGELDLRGLTGATVMAITRDPDGQRQAIVPTVDDTLEAGDIVAVAGTADAIAAVRELLARDATATALAATYEG